MRSAIYILAMTQMNATSESIAVMTLFMLLIFFIMDLVELGKGK